MIFVKDDGATVALVGRMLPRHLLALFATATCALIGCSTEPSIDDGSDEGAVRGGPITEPTWIGPPPGAKRQPLDKPLVLTAWKKVQDSFYNSTSGYTTPRNAAQPPDSSEPSQCLQVCPDFWGDLVCHFYCTNPTYDSTFKPNIRACFSGATRGLQRTDTNPPRRVTYWEAYDHCVFQRADWVAGTPTYDQAKIDDAKQTGKMPGPLKWVKQNADDAFRYVMFTGFNPTAFHKAQEQELINEFYDVRLTKKNYGKDDAAEVAECNTKRPLRPQDPQDGTHCSTTKRITLTDHPAFPQQEAAMKAYARAHGWSGT